MTFNTDAAPAAILMICVGVASIVFRMRLSTLADAFAGRTWSHRQRRRYSRVFFVIGVAALVMALFVLFLYDA